MMAYTLCIYIHTYIHTLMYTQDLLTDMDNRKMIRPLVDFIERAKRQLKSFARK